MSSWKNYETPEMQVIKFGDKDVVLASVGADNFGGYHDDTYASSDPYQ